MQIRDIVHQPMVGGMASGAVIADGHLVHVRVAGNTIALCLGKNQCFVAVPAIGIHVLACKWKTCFIVVEKGSVNGHGQPGRF